MSSEPSERSTSRRNVWGLIGLLAVGLAVCAALGWFPRVSRARRLEAQEAERSAPMRVLVDTVHAAPGVVDVTLPATTAATETVLVRAHESGYVRAVHVNIGSRVRRGEVLAEIAAPERDEEIRAVAVRIAEAEARVALAESSAGRVDRLGERGVMTTQERDDARFSLRSATAELEAAQSERRRLEALRGYQRIVAPFDGVVTQRSVDHGALVTANGTPLFELARHEIKVLVEIPQDYARAATVGTNVELFAEGRALATAPIARTASALSPGTRMMRVELDAPPDAQLLAGMFLRAKLSLPRTRAAVLLPSRALVVANEGSSVWVVDGENRARKRALSVVRDLGAMLEVDSGLADGDRVVLSAPDGLREGASVDPVSRPAAPPARGAR